MGRAGDSSGSVVRQSFVFDSLPKLLMSRSLWYGGFEIDKFELQRILWLCCVVVLFKNIRSLYTISEYLVSRPQLSLSGEELV